MPLYFAYGSNMDRAAMSERCPRSRALGPARLARHRLFIMEEGFASVRRDPLRAVHGVLWDLALADVRALDKYEEIARGLYAKIIQPVLVEGGARRALIYVGASVRPGAPRADYIAGVIAAARSWEFPQAYMRELMALAPAAAQGAARPAVTPRFATPFDR